MYQSVKESKEVTKTGLYLIDNDPYHAGEGISSTNLKHLLRSPAHYLEAKKDSGGSTPALVYGQALHTACLEPELFDQQFVLQPEYDGPKSKNPWKKEWDIFKKENADRTIIPDGADIKGIQDALKAHGFAQNIIDQCEHEIAAYVVDGEHKYKAKCDILDTKNGIIWDLKTTEDARENPFVRSVMKYKYHLSAAYYLQIFTAASGITFDKFGWIAVEKKAPYGIGVYMADEEMLTRGNQEVQKATEIYHNAVETNHWPVYKESVEYISLPHYY